MLRKLLIPMLLIGCGDATGPDAIAGNYALQSVNGADLPFIIVQVLEDKAEITVGSVRINADLTWSSSITAEITEGGVTITETETSTGTYTLNETAITFIEQGDTFSGSFAGSTLTIIDDGLTWVFRK